MPFLEQATNPLGGIELQSLGVLQSLSNPTEISKSDILGLVLGAGLGWYISNKFPNMVIKYVGVIVGAELGILVARMIGKR